MDHRSLAGLAAAVAAPFLVSLFFVEAPTALMAGLIGGAVWLLPRLLDGLMPETWLAALRLQGRPLAIASLVVLVIYFPYLITPDWAAREVPLADLAGDLEAYRHRRIAVRARLEEIRPFPLSIGSDEVFRVALSADDAHFVALYARAPGDPAPSRGDEIRLIGVVQTYGGPDLCLVARDFEVLDPP